MHKAILPCPSWLDPSLLKTHHDADSQAQPMTPPKAPPAPGRTRYILQVYDPAQVDPRRPGVKPWQFKTLDLPSDFTLEEVNAEASVWLAQQYPELVFDKARGIWRG